MESKEIRQKFLDFFAGREHKIIPSSSLIPTDPSVLFTTAGMQQFKSYYTDPPAAEREFGSRRVASIQKCFRTSDIDEVGDESHLTFFEMLGNFSFGGYGKPEAIEYAYEFITKDLRLPIDYVTVFAGDDWIAKDEESKKIWQALGLTDVREGDRADNFWGPTGEEGPCGPTTEIYVDGVEIWNIVFNQYYQHPDKNLENLATLGVDTGMGLERLVMVAQGKKNIFETDLFNSLIKTLPPSLADKSKRIVVDHERASVFLIADGVLPSNKGAGYVLRRLIRRATLHGAAGSEVAGKIIEPYEDFYPDIRKKWAEINRVLLNERKQFAETLKQGVKELNKLTSIDATKAFWLYETYGLPFEIVRERFPQINKQDFEVEFQKHQEISRAGVVGKFAGGLADHEPKTIKLHTAHHLLLAALQSVLRKNVKQRGSNINQERLRLDFSFDRKLSDDEKRQVENLVNEKIRENLPVVKKEMSRVEAEKLGAEMEFGTKYGESVSVYFIGGDPSTGSGRAFSAEFCAGPHVARTGELGHFKILKDESVAQGIRRIKAILE